MGMGRVSMLPIKYSIFPFNEQQGSNSLSWKQASYPSSDPSISHSYAPQNAPSLNAPSVSELSPSSNECAPSIFKLVRPIHLQISVPHHSFQKTWRSCNNALEKVLTSKQSQAALKILTQGWIISLSEIPATNKYATVFEGNYWPWWANLNSMCKMWNTTHALVEAFHQKRAPPIP